MPEQMKQHREKVVAAIREYLWNAGIALIFLISKL